MISPWFHGEGWPVSDVLGEGWHAGAGQGKRRFRAGQGVTPNQCLRFLRKQTKKPSKEEGVGSVPQKEASGHDNISSSAAER